MSRSKRLVGVVMSLGMIATTFAMVEGSASAAGGTFPVGLSCTGVVGDNASTLGDSRSTLAALGSNLAIGAEVTSNVPTKVRPGAGGFDVSFGFKVIMPESVVKAARDILKVSSVKVTDAKFAVNLSGAAAGTIARTMPTMDVSLATSPTVVTSTISGKVNPTSAGLIQYTPGAISFGLAINKSITSPIPLTINTLNIVCNATGDLGSTSVQVPGAPNIEPGVIVVPNARPMQPVNIDLGPHIFPDDGNPVIPDSIAIVNAPPGTNPSLSGNLLSMTFPFVNTDQTVNMKVCGASRIQKGRPGNDEVQSFTWSTGWSSDGNAHPLGFSLKFKGQETKVLSTSWAGDLFGNRVPTPLRPEDDFLGLNRWNSHFEAPSAAEVQSALEGLSGVGVGGVKVTSTATGYEFTFSGKLAKSPQPKIEIGQWATWFPAEQYESIMAAINSAGSGGGGSGTGTGGGSATAGKTLKELQDDLAAGKLTIDQFFAALPDAFVAEIIAGIDIPTVLKQVQSLYPSAPTFATKTAGVTFIADAPTGPLCTQFQVQVKPDQLYLFGLAVFFYKLNEAKVLAATMSRGCAFGTHPVKVRVKQRYRSHDKLRTRYVTKTVCRK